MTAAVNVESIKLQLIKNQTLGNGVQGGEFAEFVFNREAIRKLVMALEFSDEELSSQIETFLFKSGEEAVPEILTGLMSQHVNVKSVCAMALIRMGRTAAKELKALYVKHNHCDELTWVVAFILDEVGEAVPESPKTALEEWEPQVVVLGKAG